MRGNYGNYTLSSARLCDADYACCGKNFFLIGRSLYVKVKEGPGEMMEFVWGLKENILGFGLAEVGSQGVGQ